MVNILQQHTWTIEYVNGLYSRGTVLTLPKKKLNLTDLISVKLKKTPHTVLSFNIQFFKNKVCLKFFKVYTSLQMNKSTYS